MCLCFQFLNGLGLRADFYILLMFEVTVILVKVKVILYSVLTRTILLIM